MPNFNFPVIPKDVRNQLVPCVVQRYGIIPVRFENDVTLLVSKEPLSSQQVELLQLHCGSMKFRVASAQEYQQFRELFEELVAAYYPSWPVMGTNCNNLEGDG